MMRVDLPVGVMATYPARAAALREVVPRVVQQVSSLHLVLNDHAEVPDWLQHHPNVHPIIPVRDTKDLGKFLPVHADPGAWVVLFDDDLLYPADYVESTLASISDLGAPDGVVFGHHGTVYHRPSWRMGWRQCVQALRVGHARPGVFRKVFDYRLLQREPVWVDQLGTGTVFARARDLMPMEAAWGAERRVDVRFAAWASAHGRSMIVLPHAAGWIGEVSTSETIYAGYTRHFPRALTDEVATFAYRNPRVGTVYGAFL